LFRRRENVVPQERIDRMVTMPPTVFYRWIHTEPRLTSAQVRQAMTAHDAYMLDRERVRRRV
jgi:hypothetical protein